MKEKDLIDYFAKTTPGDKQKEEMLHAILKSGKGEEILMKRVAKKLSLAAVAVIIICILATTTAIAISLGWHEKLIEYLSATDEQINKLDSAVNMPEATLTQNGLTVTVKQTLADSMGVYVLYEITAPENIEFTDDIVFGTYIFVVSAHNPKDKIGSGVFSAPEVLAQQGNKRTVLQYYSTPDIVANGSATLILGDLGHDSGTGFVALPEGRWELKWEFSYVDTSKTFEMNKPINVDGNAYAITKMIISPMSMCVYVEGAQVRDMNPIVTFKDGSQLVCDASLGFQSVADSGAGSVITQIYRRFESLIDMEGIAAVTIGGVTIPIDASENTEADKPSSWAVEQIDAAIAAGIVPAGLQAHYSQAITRSEFCALAVNLYEIVTGEVMTKRAQFNDTADINVQKLAALDVVNGVGGGNFDPHQSLTREQAATILARLAKAMGKPLAAGQVSFADKGDITSWAADAVGQVQAAGIMNGIGDNRFAPQSPYTREQGTVTLMRLYDY